MNIKNVKEMIKRKIIEIEKNLSEIKEILRAIETEATKRTIALNNKIPKDEELRDEFQILYEVYNQENSSKVKMVLQDKTVKYLKYFCKANSLPIDMKKYSKDKVIDEIIQWMAQKRAISSKVK